LGHENTNSAMGIQYYMREVDRTYTIQIGVWEESSSTIPIYGTQSTGVEEITNMTERGTIKERLHQLMEMEEDRILVGFHQEV
jgi:hypothetical protein